MEEKYIKTVYESNQIRQIWDNGERYFVIIDIVAVFSKSKNPYEYLKGMKKRITSFREVWSQIVKLLIVKTKGGRQPTSCTNAKGLYLIIMAIPSPNTKAFKLWLKEVGYEYVQKIDKNMNIKKT